MQRCWNKERTVLLPNTCLFYCFEDYEQNRSLRTSVWSLKHAITCVCFSFNCSHWYLWVPGRCRIILRFWIDSCRLVLPFYREFSIQKRNLVLHFHGSQIDGWNTDHRLKDRPQTVPQNVLEARKHGKTLFLRNYMFIHVSHMLLHVYPCIIHVVTLISSIHCYILNMLQVAVACSYSAESTLYLLVAGARG